MTTQQISKNIEQIISLHESMRNAYFWSAPSSAQARRAYEQTHSAELAFDYNGKSYFFSCETTCSAKNVYYRGHFTVDGNKKTVAAAKKLLQQIAAQQQNVF